MPSHRSTSIALILAAVLVLPAAPTVAGTGSGRVATATIGRGPVERVVVRWSSTAGTDRGLTRARRMTAAHAGTKRAAVVSGDTDAWWLPEPVSGAGLLTTLADIAATPGVAEVAVDRRMTADLVPDDTYFGSQWDMGGGYGIDATTAWDTTTGSPGVVVAVLDTGITVHSEFAGRVVAGYDFISDVPTANDGNGRDADPSDPGDWVTTADAATPEFAGCPVDDSSWHGTHVAGTIGARGNNGSGVAGIAWETRIEPVRVLGKCGGWESDIAAAIRWAAGGSVAGVPDNATPARVINLSFGGPGACDTTAMQPAITEAVGRGTLVVVASGNSSQPASGFTPANCPGVIAVGATDRNGQRAPFSNYGSAVTLSAPGMSIASTLNAGKQGPGAETYAVYSGTSMATPHVSGVAALALAVKPSLTVSALRSLLTGTATAFAPDAAALGCPTALCGAGIVNAAAVVAQAIAPSPPSVAFTSPAPGTTATVTAATTLSVGWSEGVAPGLTLAGRALVMDEAPASSATSCAAVTAWTSSASLAATGPAQVVAAGSGGRCLQFVVTVSDSSGASATATSGRLFVFRPGSIRVNSGAAATRSRSVSLAITAPTGAGWMRIANSSAGLAVATSRGLRGTVAWTLTSGNGSKRVYVRFGGGSLGTAVTSSDGIVLDTRAPTVAVSRMTVVARYADGSRTVRITLSASGTGSGLTGYRLTTTTAVPGTTKAWANPLSVRTKAATLYLRVRDGAGNWSGWTSFHPPR